MFRFINLTHLPETWHDYHPYIEQNLKFYIKQSQHLTGPLIVPVPRRSPGLKLQPLIVWCASCWVMVQYLIQIVVLTFKIKNEKFKHCYTYLVNRNTAWDSIAHLQVFMLQSFWNETNRIQRTKTIILQYAFSYKWLKLLLVTVNDSSCPAGLIRTLK